MICPNKLVYHTFLFYGSSDYSILTNLVKSDIMFAISGTKDSVEWYTYFCMLVATSPMRFIQWRCAIYLHSRPLSYEQTSKSFWRNCWLEGSPYLEDGKLKCTGIVRMQNANIMAKNIHFFLTLVNHVAKELGVEVGEYTVRIWDWVTHSYPPNLAQYWHIMYHIFCILLALRSIGSQIFATTVVLPAANLLGLKWKSMFSWYMIAGPMISETSFLPRIGVHTIYFSFVLELCKGGETVKRLVLLLHRHFQSTTPKKRDRCLGDALGCNYVYNWLEHAYAYADIILQTT